MESWSDGGLGCRGDGGWRKPKARVSRFSPHVARTTVLPPRGGPFSPCSLRSPVQSPAATKPNRRTQSRLPICVHLWFRWVAGRRSPTSDNQPVQCAPTTTPTRARGFPPRCSPVSTAPGRSDQDLAYELCTRPYRCHSWLLLAHRRLSIHQPAGPTHGGRRRAFRSRHRDQRTRFPH